jgi:UrcA family protein
MTRTQISRATRRLPQRLSAALAALAMTGLMLVTVNARADEAFGEFNQITVRYSSDDLASESQAAGVYAKLKRAAHQVCRRQGIRMTLDEHARYRECYQGALADAVRTVDKPALSALHARTTEDTVG